LHSLLLRERASAIAATVRRTIASNSFDPRTASIDRVIGSARLCERRLAKPAAPAEIKPVTLDLGDAGVLSGCSKPLVGVIA
jgi:hypothetical protein